MRQRFLKPAMEHRQKLFNEEMMNNQDLGDEQRRIEEEIAEQKRMQIYNLEMREAAEVAEAAKDYEQDNSQEVSAANQSNFQLMGNESVNMQEVAGA